MIRPLLRRTDTLEEAPVRRERHAARRIGIAVIAATVALFVSVGAIAYWTTAGTGTADASVGTIAGATISTPSTTSTGSITLTWDVQASMTPATENGGITYTVEQRLGANAFAAIGSGSCSGTLAFGTLSCLDSVSASGTYTYRVVARYGTAWTALSNEATVVANLDADPPTTTITFPVDATTYNAVDYGPGCTPTGVCGTATDATGVDTVRVSVRRLADGAYWDGSGYTSFGELFLDAALLAPGAATTDWSLALPLPGDGQYTIDVEAKDTVGNDSAPTNTSTATFTIDATAPTQVVSAVAAVNAFLSGGTLYYRGSTSGSFQLSAAVTDNGTGPESATFPGIAAGGWTHAAETVTTGTGADPTKTYTSSGYSWTPSPSNPAAHTVTGADDAGNTVTTSLTFDSDTAGPTGGALTVNGGVATTAGSTTANFSGSFPIDVRTSYDTDTESGVAGTTLVRERATLAGNVCATTWTNATTIVGSPTQSGLASGFCYRYTLTGTDNVGNTAAIFTMVKLDTSAPTFGSPALTLAETGAFAFVSGTTAYYNGGSGTGSSITVSAPNVTDPETTIQDVTFPALADGFAGGGSDASAPYSATYTWSASADSGAKSVTATNGIANTSTSSFSLVRDVTAPAGGALTVNATAASGAGTTSSSTSGSFAIGRTDYTEAGPDATQAGLASGGSTLVRETATLSGNTCGAFASPVVLAGSPAQSGLATGCYRYTLAGVDNVGNTTNISTIVKVDTTAPAFGTPALTLSASGTFAYYPGTGTTAFYNGASGTSSSITVNAPNVADPESGVQSVGFPSPAGFSGGGADPASPFTATYTWSSSTANGSQTVTATNGVNGSSNTSFTLTRDVTNPGSASLTVNTVAANTGGSTSVSTSGTFTIGTRNDYNDSSSGLASSTLVREEAPLATDGSGSCGAFGSATTIVGSPAQNAAAGISTGTCYRYTLTGVDNVSNSASISTIVKVDTTAPDFGSPALTLADTGPFAHYPGTGTVVYYNGPTGTGSSFSVSASNVADPQSGIQSVAFPNIAGFTGGLTDTSSPFTTTYTWTSSNASGSQTVTATNGIGSTSTSTFSLVRDVTAPAGGVLNVNGTAGSGAGSTSSSTTGSFAIGTRTDYTETQSATASGLATSELVREQATLGADFTCGTFGGSTTIVGNPVQNAAVGISTGNCYRYTLSGADNVANAASLATTVKVDTVAPTATNVQLTGNNGTVAAGDTVVVTYSELMDASSFCAGWANDAGNQSETGNGIVTVTIANSGANDILTVASSSCTGGFKFGSVALGGDYVSATRTFSGNGGNRSELAWNVTARTLTIRVGSASGAVNSGILAGTPSYTADTALKDRAGNAIGAGPFTGSSSRF